MQTDTLQLVAVIIASFVLAGCNTRSNHAPPADGTPTSMPDANAEDRAIAAFVRKGGRVTVDDDGNVTSLYFSDTVFSSADLAHFAAFPKLRELNFATCDVDDAIWPYLRGMSDLESMTLWRAAITDNGMENLRHFPKLKSLDIRQTPVGDSGLAHVAQLKSLEILELLGTRITGAGLLHVRGLTNLKELGLVQTSVDDAGLKLIRGSTGLTELSLEGSDITNDGLVHVGQLTNLKLLTIHNTAITERGLVHLEGLTNLRTFYLCVPVTEVGLRSLKKMTKLDDLYIGDVADESRDFLQSQLPDVGVY